MARAVLRAAADNVDGATEDDGAGEIPRRWHGGVGGPRLRAWREFEHVAEDHASRLRFAAEVVEGPVQHRGSAGAAGIDRRPRRPGIGLWIVDMDVAEVA